MSMYRSIGGIGEKDQNYFKVYKVLVSEARHILHYIFGLQFPEGITQSFINKVKKLEKVFNDDLLKTMASNSLGDNFDVTLLCACITASNKSMFKVINPVRKFRNTLIHNTKEVANVTEMEKLINDLRNLLINVIQKSQTIHNLKEGEIKAVLNELDQNINEIVECDMPISDIKKYRQEIRELRDANKTLFYDEGVPTLKETFKGLSNVDPISWLTGRDRLNVKTVYTPLDILDKTSKANSNRQISLEELLELQTEDDKKPAVIVVEGDAGSGKSTLAKYILRDWAESSPESQSSSIRGLDNYEAVLYFECKTRSISSFLELLQTLVPYVAYQMTEDDLIRSVLDLRTLVIVDGLDEMRENSETLLREMLEKHFRMSTAALHFIITTRPHEMQKVSILCGGIPWIHTRIKGIPQERRVEFVSKLHDALIAEGSSSQNTSRLGDYVKQSQARLGEHYRLPLNLSLLTYLWAEDPKTVHSLTSATSLYSAVLKLLKSRVISRINGYTDAIRDKVNKFIETLCEVYLRTHVSGDLQISEESRKIMSIACSELKLPFEDMVGAFFAVDNVWTTYEGNQTCLSAPHKSIMEFFCASHIFTCLTTRDHEQSQARDILNTLLKKDGEDRPNFSHHQNVLLHLGGLLALRKLDALHKHGAELVSLLQEGGVKDEQWLDLVAEAECDSFLSTLVAQQISHNLVVRDGHTLAAIEIFKHLDSGISVQVIFECEIQYIHKVEEFMEALSERDCDVKLLLKNHWKNPSNGNSTQLLKSLYNKSCRVSRFTGNLDNLKVLSEDTENLRLTIANNQQAKAICSDITTLHKKLNLNYLGLHITTKVSPAALKPLPVVKPVRNECGTLWISGVHDNNIDRACNIARALLQKNKKFNSIMFPRSQLSVEGYKKLLQKLKVKEVEVSQKGDVKLDSEKLNNSDVKSLRIYTQEMLGCKFHWGDELSVW